jgi:hypothetical protein
LPSSDHHHTLWASGNLRCVLVTILQPRRYAVQVLEGEHPVCSEPCTNADEAAVIAERLWDVFVDPAV